MAKRDSILFYSGKKGMEMAMLKLLVLVIAVLALLFLTGAFLFSIAKRAGIR